MFADFRVHGLNTTFFQCFHHRSTPTYRKRKRKGFAHLVQPMYAKVREHGAPVQGARPCEEERDLSPNQRMTITSLGSPSRLFIRRKPRDLRFHFRGQRICRGRIASRLRFPINANRRFLFRFSRRFCTPEFKYRSVLAGLKPRSPGLKPGLASFSCASIQHAKISSASQPRPDT